ncbi:nicotinic acid mononucleotide adenylyltransferase [Gluconobacter thailandicus F149-1 = NBRC 100600]|uniref:Probable nicotinate-nucleotide adenylyltransferase n=2 Tax=Gluconobacter thailandicus TaxID=257438 RepID=A0ABQ0IWG4_GLUTH|nr:nicotinate-nucleotide adenylyltransferase [Gluconobacter thailandicus]GAC89102.1 nicotinic acid mononucleotide adenylyltransferase [Gluconobacter thailandicus NBRC 3255]GAD26534.1 nicotinic acid mononucleotide adenylyltransferase [Gluconobacter thailandicus NBRC 3257]GAN92471.1 nicotinic acid mononucleotide adenylyltransferase [Gluconobacter thailandicus F149-1 = NBRC 100600]GEL88344.1 putative nicotinate-nucleotide adenylyltransferase [Gluconobacter thailandicus F149-1 = NBRC 100600]
MIPTFGDGRRMRIGLLGGSFNPAHIGHLQVAQRALRALRLDQVWLMVSPGNPLKPRKGMGTFRARLASAQRFADGRRVCATDIEFRLKQRYTVKTVALLKQRFPNVQFVWLMGADGLAQFSRWKNWRALARMIPIAILPRPGSVTPALHGAAASVLRRNRRPSREAPLLGRRKGSAWTFLSAPQNDISATALRESGQTCLDADQE